jgi:hypothetical protein
MLFMAMGFAALNPSYALLVWVVRYSSGAFEEKIGSGLEGGKPNRKVNAIHRPSSYREETPAAMQQQR